MAIELCEVSSGYGVFSEALAVTLVPPALADAGADFTDRAALSVAVQLSDGGDLSDAVHANSAAYVVEAGGLSEALALSGSFSAYAVDRSGDFSDSVRMFWSAVLADTGQFSDSVEESQPGAVLREDGALSDAAGPFAVASSLTDAGALNDSLVATKSALLADTGDFSDAAVPALSVGDDLLDSGDFLDLISGVVRSSQIVLDTGRLSESVAHLAHMRIEVEDGGDFSDFAGSGRGGAWSASTETFAMSRWDGEPFNSIAHIDGVLYAASEAGLYRLERGSQSIDAFIRGGLSDYNDPNLKHASYFYCAYTSPGTLRVVVGYAPAGVEESVQYTLPARAAMSVPMPNRVKVGRGMRSRYWRTTIENVGGADFAFHGGSMVVDGASRRV